MFNEVVETKTGKALIFYNLPYKEINNKKYYLMKFLFTGYTMYVDPNMLNCVEDPYFPKFFGVGYIGECESIESLELLCGGVGSIRNALNEVRIDKYGNLQNANGMGIFSKWLFMMAKVYLNKFKGYKFELFVEPRWHSFYNFAMDLQRISGFIDIGTNLLDSSCTLNYKLAYILNDKLDPNIISPYSTMWITDPIDKRILNGNSDINYNTEIFSKYLGKYRKEQPKCLYDLLHPLQSDIDDIIARNSDNPEELEKEINDYRQYIRYLEINSNNQLITDIHKSKYGFFDYYNKISNYKITKKLEKQIIDDFNNQLLFRNI